MTDMPTVPAGFGGEMTVSRLSSVTFMPVPDIPPNRTSVAPENPDPVMVTTVPPRVEPEAGEIPVNPGFGNSYVYMAFDPSGYPAPAAFLMDIATVPGEDAGVMTVSRLSSRTLRLHPGFPPNRTESTP